MESIQSKIFINATLFLIFMSQLVSCENATEWENNIQAPDYLVVNGLITNEKKEHEIKLSKTVDQLNETEKPISGAIVTIFDGDTLFILAENPANSGIYRTDTNFRAFINKIYTLSIFSDGKNYYSSVYTIPVTPFNPLKYKLDEGKQMFALDSVTLAFDNNESAMYEISIDWTQVSGYESIAEYAKKAVIYYYSLSTIDVSEIFESEREKIYFPKGTTIIEKKYSLTPDHSDFLRSMLLETEWRGSLFDVAHGNVKTNLSKGALGFFGACTVIQETIIVK